MRRAVYYTIGIIICLCIGVAIGHFTFSYFYPTPDIYFTPGMSCEDGITSHIDTSDTIDIAVYSITNDNIVFALNEAHERGAKIRIITDYVQSRGAHSLVPKLRAMGIPVRTNKSVHKIMHNKFAIFDNTAIVTGSYNWTNGATGYNVENCIFFENLAPKYMREFEKLWNLYKD